ncbi:hypothetical protein [Grimontia marina]|uniref:hypothetical protein n=1 Tax=Grimontia marina TaxID=646534 RepID=UPI0012FCB9AE|nr:hypothetical protein [Grimontia marina]
MTINLDGSGFASGEAGENSVSLISAAAASIQAAIGASNITFAACDIDNTIAGDITTA